MGGSKAEPAWDGRARSEPGGIRWRTGGEVKGKLSNGVGSQYSHATSECGISSITQADAHTSVATSRLNWRPHRFKWTSPFRGKTKSGFCACALTFRTSYTQLRAIYSVDGGTCWSQWIGGSMSMCWLYRSVALITSESCESNLTNPKNGGSIFLRNVNVIFYDRMTWIVTDSLWIKLRSILLLVANGHNCIKCTKADVLLITPDDGQKGCPKHVQ